MTIRRRCIRKCDVSSLQKISFTAWFFVDCRCFRMIGVSMQILLFSAIPSTLDSHPSISITIIAQHKLNAWPHAAMRSLVYHIEKILEMYDRLHSNFVHIQFLQNSDDDHICIYADTERTVLTLMPQRRSSIISESLVRRVLPNIPCIASWK